MKENILEASETIASVINIKATGKALNAGKDLSKPDPSEEAALAILEGEENDENKNNNGENGKD